MSVSNSRLYVVLVVGDVLTIAGSFTIDYTSGGYGPEAMVFLGAVMVFYSAVKIAQRLRKEAQP